MVSWKYFIRWRQNFDDCSHENPFAGYWKKTTHTLIPIYCLSAHWKILVRIQTALTLWVHFPFLSLIFSGIDSYVLAACSNESNIEVHSLLNNLYGWISVSFGIHDIKFRCFLLVSCITIDFQYAENAKEVLYKSLLALSYYLDIHRSQYSRLNSQGGQV